MIRTRTTPHPQTQRPTRGLRGESSGREPDASLDVCRAVQRYRTALPPGELHEVDRAVVAVLLSFGRELDHDAALQSALILLERFRQTVKRLRNSCRLDSEGQIARRVEEDASQLVTMLRAIPPRMDPSAVLPR